jgi:UDP-3-O-[3-hydroxymyristoyl] glucosamine N-acyltransferase
VGEGSRIGEDCVLQPGAVVRERCVVGNRVLLQPGVVLGSDGFGFAFDPSGPAHVKVPQIGTVRIEDDVEVGAGSCIDRATTGETVVGRGTKIDNLVQIAHNVRVGPLSILCAQVGISGSTEIGEGVVLAGQVGVVGHVHIGDGARIAAQSGVPHDVAPGATVSGYPAVDHALWLRQSAALKQLPELLRELRELRARVAALEARKDDS